MLFNRHQSPTADWNMDSPYSEEYSNRFYGRNDPIDTSKKQLSIQEMISTLSDRSVKMDSLVCCYIFIQLKCFGTCLSNIICIHVI